MLYKLSFICLNLFVAASFFSPTLRFIFLIPGFLFWILAIIFSKDFDSKELAKKYFSPLGLSFLFFIIVDFSLKAFYEQSFTSALKSFFGSHLQWFWLIFFLEFYTKETSVKEPLNNVTLSISRSLEGILKPSSHIKTTNDEVLSLTTLVSATILSLVITFQFMGFIPLNGEYFGVLSQPFTSSGILICSLFIGLSFFQAAHKESKKVIFLLALSLLQIIAIIFLGQLSTWFGLILGLFVFILGTKFFSKKQILIIFMVSIFLLGLAYNASPRIKAKINRLRSFQSLIENKSIQCRLEIWKINYLLWLEKPVLGLKKIMPYNCVLSPDKPATKMTHAHNIFLQNLFEGGLIRFIFWIIFYLTLLFNLLKKRAGGSLPFLCGFLALSVEGFFENWWGDSEVLTLFFLMMLIFNSKAYSPSLKN